MRKMPSAIRLGKTGCASALFAFFLFSAPTVSFAGVAVSTISCEALRLMEFKQTPGLSVIDVRLPPDFDKSHVQGARNIPKAALASAGLPKSGLLVLYCGSASCPLSHMAAETLMADGYQNVSVLDGGLAAWSGKGYPTQTSSAPKRIKIKHTSQREVRAEVLSKRAFIIDLRQATGYRAGHIPGAVNIPLENLPQNLSEIPRGATVLVYDLVQSRMREGVQELKKAGIKARELSGGFAAWVRGKNSVEVK